MCLRNTKATSMAGAELQELLQSLMGHCKDYGFTECSGSHWRAVIGSEMTLNRYTLTAMIRDWQEGKNGSKTGIGFPGLSPKATSVQIKKKFH